MPVVPVAHGIVYVFPGSKPSWRNSGWRLPMFLRFFEPSIVSSRSCSMNFRTKFSDGHHQVERMGLRPCRRGVFASRSFVVSSSFDVYVVYVMLIPAWVRNAVRTAGSM